MLKHTSKFFWTITAVVLLMIPQIGFAAGKNPTLINPLKNVVDTNNPIPSLSALVIDTMFGIAGMVALVMFVWGGLLWLTSAGSSKQVDKGKMIFQWTTLGVIGMFASYTIVSFIFSSVGDQAPSAPSVTGGVGVTAGTSSANKFCCLDHANLTAKTVNSVAECASGATKTTSALEGACELMKFCGKQDPAVPAGEACIPQLKNLTCIASQEYTSYGECMTASGYKSTGGGETSKTPANNCEKIGGVCKDTKNGSAGGYFITGFCPGTATTQCLLPLVSGKTTSNKCGDVGGQCLDSSKTTCEGGSFVSGLCSGAAQVRCCVKNK